MELDFTGLFTSAAAPAALEKQEEGTGTHPEEKKPAEGQETPNRGIVMLQREADIKGKALEDAQRIRQEYQDNSVKTAQLQAEILRGIRDGADITALFLTAVKAVSLCTGNHQFYNQAQEELITIHGTGLQEPAALRMDLEATQERLQRLERAAQSADTAEDRNRIQAAIKAHRAKIERLQGSV